ncbi:MAG: hypothetical protein EB153_09145 [Nitrosopumilaceae archaeon]|nr:hypothetical protein [Nitrosopumilaceae archaeon]
MSNIQPSDTNQNNSVYSKIQDPIEAIKVMGEMIAGSGMFGCVKVEQGMVLAMQCLAESKPPLELAKTYHIVDGKLSMRSDAMLGRYLASGGKVKWLERSDARVSAMWICDNNEIEISITFEEMKKSGVIVGKNGAIKDVWRRHPRQMLNQVNESQHVIEVVQETDSNVSGLHARLDELLLKFEPNASQYLIEKGYLKNGQTYKDLDAMTAQRLIASPSKIITILSNTESKKNTK